MSTQTNDLLRSGADTIRTLVQKNAQLEAEIRGFGEFKTAIATIETLVKSGRLEDTDEPIVKRAETLLVAENRQLLTKQAARRRRDVRRLSN
jgi:predicted acetyltransferase